MEGEKYEREREREGMCTQGTARTQSAFPQRVSALLVGALPRCLARCRRTARQHNREQQNAQLAIACQQHFARIKESLFSCDQVHSSNFECLTFLYKVSGKS